MVDSRERLVVCPVSRETLPNLLVILHEDARRVCLVPSGDGGDAIALALERLRGELERLGIPCEVREHVDPFDAAAVHRAVSDALAGAGGELATTVNITPGTKVMACAATIAGIAAGADLAYVDTGDNRLLRHRARKSPSADDWVSEPLKEHRSTAGWKVVQDASSSRHLQNVAKILLDPGVGVVGVAGAHWAQARRNPRL